MKRTALVCLLALCLGSVAARVAAQRPAPKTGRRPAPAVPAASASRPAAASRREQVVPFRAGEVLTYDVSWSSYVTAGTFTLTVREKKPSYDSVAYYIVAEGRPSGLLSKLYSLYYKADTLLDVYTLLPQRGSLYSEEGRRRRMKVTVFDQAARKADYEIRTATLVKAAVALPPYSQDPLSAVYVLRALPLKPGSRMTMPLCDSGSTYKVQVVVGGRESVKTGLGPIDALRIAPTIVDRRNRQVGAGLALWMSDDARHLPVKMQGSLTVGSFVLTLTSVK
jgi:hypothetical protein